MLRPGVIKGHRACRAIDANCKCSPKTIVSLRRFAVLNAQCEYRKKYFARRGFESRQIGPRTKLGG